MSVREASPCSRPELEAPRFPAAPPEKFARARGFRAPGSGAPARGPVARGFEHVPVKPKLGKVPSPNHQRQPGKNWNPACGCQGTGSHPAWRGHTHEPKFERNPKRTQATSLASHRFLQAQRSKTCTSALAFSCSMRVAPRHLCGLESWRALPFVPGSAHMEAHSPLSRDPKRIWCCIQLRSRRAQELNGSLVFEGPNRHSEKTPVRPGLAVPHPAYSARPLLAMPQA